jgi:hypothetical protein
MITRLYTSVSRPGCTDKQTTELIKRIATPFTITIDIVQLKLEKNMFGVGVSIEKSF